MFNVTYSAFRVCDLFSSLTTSSAVTVSKPFCGLLSQLSSQKDLWAGKPFWLLMCDWVLFLSCRIVFGFCFGWAFLPSCRPAGALCCAGGGRSSSACSFMSFTYLTPFSDSLAIFSLCLAVTFSSSPLQFSTVPFSFGDVSPPPHFVSSPLAIPYSPPLLCDCLSNAGHPVGLAKM